tara:strand:+ start:2208 stop:5186 length:2979 start_codon:yes stop_codon:yes gene_type:complete
MASTWTVDVDFGAGWVDISDDATRVRRHRIMHRDLRCAVNTATFECTDLTHANSFLTTTADIPVRIQKDAADWFIGVVRPNYQSVTYGNFDGLQIEAVDDSYEIQKTIDQDLTWQNYKVCDTGATGSSIVHQLLVTAGYALGDMSLTTINKTISWYVVEKRGEKTYWNEINALLYEFGYVLDVDESGVFIMRPMHPTSLSTSALVDADMVQPFRVSRKIAKWEAARVNWNPVDTLVDILVFSDRTDENETNPCNISIANTIYYPTGASASDAVLAVYRVEDAELLNVTNEVLIWNSWGTLTAPTQTFGSKSADIRFLGGAGGGTLTQFDIRGDAIIKDKTKVRRSVVYGVANTERILEVNTRFIEDETDGDQLASDLVNYYDYAKFTYKFEVDPDFTIDVSDELALNTTAHSITTDVRVVELTEDTHGVRHAVCEGISAYSLLTVEEQGIVISGLMTIARLENHFGKEGYVVAASTYTGSYNSRCDGTADEVQINAAITQLNSEGGGIVILTQGTYNIAAAIVHKAGVSFVGSGEGTIIKPTTSFTAMTGTGSDGSELDGIGIYSLKIDGTNLSIGVHAISCIYCDRLIIRDVLVTDSGSKEALPFPPEAAYAFDLDACDSLSVERCIFVDCAMGPRFVNGCTGTARNCEVYNTSAVTIYWYGVTLQNESTIDILNWRIHDVETITAGVALIGIYLESVAEAVIIRDNIIEDISVWGGDETTTLQAIYTGTDSHRAQILRNTITRVISYTGLYDAADQREMGIAIHNWSSDDQAIAENRIENCANGIVIQGSGAARTELSGNRVFNCGQFIDRGGCEHATDEPMVFGETVANTAALTSYAQSSAQAYKGTYSWLATMDGTAVTARVDLTDDVGTSNMHGLIAGIEYTLEAWFYVPSGGVTPANCTMYIQDYNGAWANTSQAFAATTDAWQKVSVTRRIVADATGVSLSLFQIGSGNHSNGDTIHVDNVRLYPTKRQNWHENLMRDDGTDTRW